MGMIAEWAEFLAAAVLGAGAGWLGNYLWTRRRTPSSVPPDPPLDEVPDLAPAPSSPPLPRPTAGPSDWAPVIPPAAEEGLGLARRIILHLSGLGRLGYDEVGRVGYTQRGMAVALSARQGSLVRVLQRLEAGGLLTVDRRHVSGVPRRLKVYRLTSLGESIARDLRHPADGARRGSAPPIVPPSVRPSPTGDWVARKSSTEVRRP
jgi:DNA-binding PadR family transcriptional regulator